MRSSVALGELQRGESVVRLAKGRGVPLSRFVGACRDLRLYPGVHASLEELRRRGMPVAAVTSLPGRLVLPVLEAKDLLAAFGVVIHAGNCRFRKPDPRPIWAALANLSVEPDKKIFYVGDTVADAEAAKRAGISFAWASYGYGRVPPDKVTVVLREFRGVLAL